ncbi:hypothetical protein [Salinarimonas rosea]|uniref:hypothetical protein n=1 Tax=Salinarimonas rosea TaxID=552063 RepID=UPI00048D88A4|nr:hypothetical protein [Salinarimonas rosea]
MRTIPSSRRGDARARSARAPDLRIETRAVALDAHASHLKRAAQSAGEAFAWSAEEVAPAPRGYGATTAIWLALGAVAGVGLWVAL